MLVSAHAIACGLRPRDCVHTRLSAYVKGLCVPVLVLAHDVSCVGARYSRLYACLGTPAGRVSRFPTAAERPDGWECGLGDGSMAALAGKHVVWHKAPDATQLTGTDTGAETAPHSVYSSQMRASSVRASARSCGVCRVSARAAWVICDRPTLMPCSVSNLTRQTSSCSSMCGGT